MAQNTSLVTHPYPYAWPNMAPALLTKPTLMPMAKKTATPILTLTREPTTKTPRCAPPRISIGQASERLLHRMLKLRTYFRFISNFALRRLLGGNIPRLPTRLRQPYSPQERKISCLFRVKLLVYKCFTDFLRSHPQG